MKYTSIKGLLRLIKEVTLKRTFCLTQDLFNMAPQM